MGEPQTQDASRREDTAAQRRARLAAYRQLTTARFALEEHEANALAALRWCSECDVEAIGGAARVASAVA
jgi:hypothetical protein